MLSVKHLIDTNSLTADDITQILDTAKAFEAVNNRDIKKFPLFADVPSLTFSLSPQRVRGLRLNLPRSASRRTA